MVVDGVVGGHSESREGFNLGKSSNSSDPALGSNTESDVTEKEKIMFSLDKWDIVRVVSCLCE